MPDEGESRPFLNRPFQDGWAQFSPNGRWVTYTSNESGQNEVYVQTFPETSTRRQITTDGGSFPRWASNGGEIVYRSRGRLMAVEVTTEPTFTWGSPSELFDGPYRSGAGAATFYDVTPGGERFLMIRDDALEARPPLNVMVNWFEELKRLVPVPQ